MARRHLLIPTLLFIATLSQTAPLSAAPVRALEHPDFSRLLLPVPPGVDWDLVRDQRRAKLALRGPVPALEVSGVFDRMPRNRIRSVTVAAAPGGANLTLELGCDCDLVVERLGDNLLAVDVRRQGGSPKAATATAGATVPGQPSALRRQALSDPDTAPASAPAPAPQPPNALPVRPRPGGAKFLSVSPPPAPDSAPEVAPGPPEADDPVLRARNALVRQLERAAEAGLLELAPDASETARMLTIARPEPEPLDEPLPRAALLPRLQPPVPERPGRIINPAAADSGALSDGAGTAAGSNAVESETDDPDLATPEPVPPAPAATPTAAPSAPAQAPGPVAGSPDGGAQGGLVPHLNAREPLAEPPEPVPGSPVCVADSQLDLRLWPQADGDLIGALGALRRSLYTDAGEIDPQAVGDLARLYITAGFGREAAALVDTAGPAADGDLLHDVSMLVEGRLPTGDGPIMASEGCVGRVSLWRAVAGADMPDRESPAWASIRESLMELPPRLRRLVGQELARHALLGNRPAAARDVLDLLDRTPGAEPRIETRVRAAIAIARGEAEYALTLIAPQIEEVASPDPEALLLHARATLAAGSVPDAEVVTLLDSAIPAHDATRPAGRALRLVRARLEAAAGDPSAALDMVRAVLTASGGTNVDAVETGRAILASLPSEARRSPTGADVILANGNLLDNGAASRQLRLDYASALIEGGLPNAAIQLLSTPRVLQDRETKLVAARAYLLLGEDAEVFRVLEGLKGGAAARVRSAVHRRSGDMVAAHAELVAVDEADAERNATALLARKWNALDLDAVSEDFRPVAAYAVNQADAPPAADPAADRPLPSLSAAQSALAESRQLRDAFSAAVPGG